MRDPGNKVTLTAVNLCKKSIDWIISAQTSLSEYNYNFNRKANKKQRNCNVPYLPFSSIIVNKAEWL